MYRVTIGNEISMDLGEQQLTNPFFCGKMQSVVSRAGCRRVNGRFTKGYTTAGVVLLWTSFDYGLLHCELKTESLQGVLLLRGSIWREVD